MTEPGVVPTPITARPPITYHDIEVDSPNLLKWWVDTSVGDFMAGAPKVDEYGAHDIEIMGAVLAVFLFREHIEDVFSRVFEVVEGNQFDQVSRHDIVGKEAAVWFYVLGKVARLVSDYMAGRAGKADTWHDITFYSMMARRIQETGQWP